MNAEISRSKSLRSSCLCGLIGTSELAQTDETSRCWLFQSVLSFVVVRTRSRAWDGQISEPRDLGCYYFEAFEGRNWSDTLGMPVIRITIKIFKEQKRKSQPELTIPLSSVELSFHY